MRRLIRDLLVNVFVLWPLSALWLGYACGYDPAHVRYWMVVYLATWSALDVIRAAWRWTGLHWRWPIYRPSHRIPGVIEIAGKFSDEDRDKFERWWRDANRPPIFLRELAR